MIRLELPGSPCWFELSTNNQDAAKAFYGNLFGWAIKDNPMGPDAVYTLFQIDGLDAAACCTLQPEQAAHGVPPNWAVYIAVENADVRIASNNPSLLKIACTCARTVPAPRPSSSAMTLSE